MFAVPFGPSANCPGGLHSALEFDRRMRRLADTPAEPFLVSQHRNTKCLEAKKKIPWTPAHVNRLRRLAGRKSVKAIGRELKRTEAAIRYKAHTERISLAMK